MIKNLLTGDFYIGSTINIKERWETHSAKLKYSKHTNKFLQNALNKYGFSYFIFGVIEFCDRESLIKREQYYIDNLNPRYNLNKIAANSGKNIIMTKEVRKKLSLSHTGVALSKEHSKSISEAHKASGFRPNEKAMTNSRLARLKAIIVWFNEETPMLFKNKFEVIDFFGLEKMNDKYISNLCLKNRKLQGLKIEYA